MSDRYQRVYSLGENLYAEGTPVIIRAGVLLKDTLRNTVLAQLKFENIDDRTIKALSVIIFPRDIKGDSIGEPVTHQYLDLEAGRDDQFGQTEAVHLPDPLTREYSVEVTEVIFKDGGIWKGESLKWESLPMPSRADAAWDQETVRQYQLEFGNIAQYNYGKTKDLWYCNCGALNHVTETACHRCRQPAEPQEALNIDDLKQRCAERLEREAAERLEAEQEQKAQKAKTKKRIVKITTLSLIAAVLLTILVFVISNVGGYYFAKSGNYEMTAKFIFEPRITAVFNKDLANFKYASDLMISEDYNKAYEKLDGISAIPSSKELALQARYLYAGQLLEQQKFDEAKQLYTELSEKKYKDAENLVKECDYQHGLYLLNEEDSPSDAKKIFKKLAEIKYKDSAQKHVDATYALSMNIREDGNYILAYSYLKEIEKDMDVQEVKKELEEEIFEAGVKEYNNGKYYRAQNFFVVVPNHKNSDKYLTLIALREKNFYEESQLEKAISDVIDILYFEDARDILVSNQRVGEVFLRGRWYSTQGGRYFTMDKTGHISYNLPWIDFGDYYRIEDGKIINYTEENYDNTRNLFKIRVIDKDTISVYCYKDGSTYKMLRR